MTKAIGWNVVPIAGTGSGGSGGSGGSSGTASGSSWMAQIGTVGGYDPSHFYTQAADSKGHSDRITVKIPPSVLAQMFVMCGDANWPEYRTPPDMIRDGLIHLLALRASQAVDPMFMQSMEDSIRLGIWEAENHRIQQLMEGWTGMAQQVEETCCAMAKQSAWGHLADYLVKQEVEADLQEEPFRGQMLGVVADWWGRVPAEVLEERGLSGKIGKEKGKGKSLG